MKNCQDISLPGCHTRAHFRPAGKTRHTTKPDTGHRRLREDFPIRVTVIQIDRSRDHHRHTDDDDHDTYDEKDGLQSKQEQCPCLTREIRFTAKRQRLHPVIADAPSQKESEPQISRYCGSLFCRCFRLSLSKPFMPFCISIASPLSNHQTIEVTLNRFFRLIILLAIPVAFYLPSICRTNQFKRPG